MRSDHHAHAHENARKENEMQETVQTLTKVRDDAAHDFEDLDGRIAQARLEGNKKALKGLRGRRDTALRDADEANDAIVLAEETDAAKRAAAKAETATARERRVNEIRAERLDAAADVDRAFEALETAVAKYQTLGRELGGLTGSGMSIARKESQSMRWGIWASAERTAALLCVPFANGRRRKTLAKLEGGE